mgnify:CR=1 FL=1
MGTYVTRERTTDVAAGPLSSIWEERDRVRRFARDRIATVPESRGTPRSGQAVQSHLTLSLSPHWRRGDPPIRPATGHPSVVRIP